MPRARRQNVRPALFQHLLDRVQSRKIAASQLALLAKWLDGELEVPEGQWYVRFPGMTVCGEGDLIKPSCFLDSRKGKKLDPGA